MSKPLSKIPIFRNVVIDHQRVHAGLADHQGLLDFAMVVQQEKAMLVVTKLAHQAFIQLVAHQAAEIDDAEPGLRFQHQGVDDSIVASEPGWFEMIVHLEVPTSRENTAS